MKLPYSITPNENYQTHSYERQVQLPELGHFVYFVTYQPSVYIHEIKYSLISNICGVNVSGGTTGGEC